MRMLGHTARYGVQRSVDVCSVLRNMCSLCRKVPMFQVSEGWEPGFWFLVSGFMFYVLIHFVPLSQGDEEQSSGGGMTNGKRKGENGKRKTHRSPLFFTYPLRFARPPNLEGQSGGYDKRKTERGKRKTHRSSARLSSLQTPPPFGHLP